MLSPDFKLRTDLLLLFCRYTHPPSSSTTDFLRRLLRCLPHTRLDERAQSSQQRPKPPAQRRRILPTYGHVSGIRRAPDRCNAGPAGHPQHSQRYRNQPGARAARHRLRDVRLPRARRATRSDILRPQPDDRPGDGPASLRPSVRLRATGSHGRWPADPRRPRPPAHAARRPRRAAAAARYAVPAAAGRAARLPASAARRRDAGLCGAWLCAGPGRVAAAGRAVCAAGRRPAAGRPALQSAWWCAAAGFRGAAAGPETAWDVRMEFCPRRSGFRDAFWFCIARR